MSQDNLAKNDLSKPIIETDLINKQTYLYLKAVPTQLPSCMLVRTDFSLKKIKYILKQLFSTTIYGVDRSTHITNNSSYVRKMDSDQR